MISCMLYPGDQNCDKYFQVRPILDHLKQKNIYCILVTGFSLYNSLFGRTGIYCSGLVRHNRVQDCSLASGKELREK